MAELIRELTGTYFDLLQNQDLQEATQIEQLDPQVVNSIRECQFSIFKHYAQLVNEAKSLPPLLRTITKLAIAVFNRYAFFTDCCRFHMRHGCGLCRNLFPQELYVEQVQSVVALAEWNLQSAIGAYEKTLIFICDEFAKNGLTSHGIADNSFSILLELRKLAAYEAGFCDGQSMREITPILHPSPEDQRDMREKAVAKDYASYGLTLSREYSKFQTAMANQSLGEEYCITTAQVRSLENNLADAIETFLSTFIKICVEQPQQLVKQKSAPVTPSQQMSVSGRPKRPATASSSFETTSYLETAARTRPNKRVHLTEAKGSKFRLELSDEYRRLWKQSFILDPAALIKLQADIQQLIKRYLQNHEAGLQAAGNGQEAVEEYALNTQMPNNVDVPHHHDGLIGGDELYTQQPQTQQHPANILDVRPYSRARDGDDIPQVAVLPSDGEDDADDRSKENCAKVPRTESPELLEAAAAEMPSLEEAFERQKDELLRQQQPKSSPAQAIPSSPQARLALDYVAHHHNYGPLNVIPNHHDDSNIMDDVSALLGGESPPRRQAPAANKSSRSSTASNGSATNNRRGPKKHWTEEETMVLAEAHTRHPKQWSLISKKYGHLFHDRSQVDLKDKVRNERIKVERRTLPGEMPDYGPWAF